MSSENKQASATPLTDEEAAQVSGGGGRSGSGQGRFPDKCPENVGYVEFPEKKCGECWYGERTEYPGEPLVGYHCNYFNISQGRLEIF
jgi:hypothetical protein